ncbi:MAG: hypothetical protein GY765_35025 [bacterium]|nr:hypothetical protein [bacterium]
MTTHNLKKEIDGFNNAFADSSLFKRMEAASLGNNVAIRIACFLSPPPHLWKNKKKSKTLNEKRQKLQKFFLDRDKSIQLSKDLFVASLPEQLVKILKACCLPSGFNKKTDTGGEMFSIIHIGKATDELGTGPLQLPLLFLGIPEPFPPSLPLGATVLISNRKIKHIAPLNLHNIFPMNPLSESNDFTSLEDLQELGISYKNYAKFDKKSKDMLKTALIFLAQFRACNSANLKYSMLIAGLEYFIQASEKGPQQYFTNMCRELCERISFQPKSAELFGNFLALRTDMMKGKNALDNPSGSVLNTLREMETFYRLLLKKSINDATMLKQGLPKLKTTLKKEIKKIELKKKWRKFPGKYLARLMDE